MNQNDDIVIKLKKVTKTYKLYPNPKARLFESLHPFGKKYHKPFHALKGINLEVKRGEVLGIVGRNGSGKSTLLKIISGVLAPTSGTVEVKGKVSALLELGSGFNPEFTGMENIYFMGALQGFGPDEMKKKVDDIIDFAEIGEHIDQPVRTYSSGMKARLAFAVSTAIEPEILILDEVLSVGDALFKHRAFLRMDDLIKKNNSAVLFVSHSNQSIIQICSQAIFLNKGEVFERGLPKIVIKEYEKYLYQISIGEDQEKSQWDKQIIEKPKKEIEKYSILEKFICDAHGTKLSQLRFKKEYKILFKIIFNKQYRNIYFGMMIRSIQGKNISGINYPNLVNALNIEKNTEYTIVWKFKNLLIPNKYFIRIDARLIEDEKVVFIEEDFLEFEVPEYRNKQESYPAGFVNLFVDVIHE